MSESLIAQAGNITVIGMLVVFVFLVILIGMMKLLGIAVAAMEKYFPQTVPAMQDNALTALAIAAAKRFQGK